MKFLDIRANCQGLLVYMLQTHGVNVDVSGEQLLAYTSCSGLLPPNKLGEPNSHKHEQTAAPISIMHHM